MYYIMFSYIELKDTNNNIKKSKRKIKKRSKYKILDDYQFSTMMKLLIRTGFIKVNIHNF